MTNIDLKDLERVSDYSIALMDDIARDIKLLSKFGGRADNNLDDINRKIDLARTKGVNVDNLDRQVLEFRISLFRGNINNKIEKLNSECNNYYVDVTKLEEEYIELKKEKDIDFEELDKLMYDLSSELTRALIKHMISNIKKEHGTSVHSMDRIAHEIAQAKKKGINVDDIEEMLFEN
ncbi:MAG: hypothetical protein QM490_04095 [Candidatus Gracilibacteria bacterium]